MLQWLARSSARWWIALLAVLAVAPCLNVGFSADDHMLRIRARPDPGVEGFTSTRFDYFSFVETPQQVREFLEAGVFAWWAPLDFKLAFLRPLSSATHALDFALWPESAPMMYAHSVLWYGLLVIVLGALYRRMHPGWISGAALLLYALDDAHGPTVGYISNRNAIVTAVFVVAALWAHDRWRRDAWGAGRVLSPIAMVLGLLSGEAAIAGFAYLFAHAVCLETGSLVRRVRPLAVHVVVGLVWAVSYKALGFGAHGSGVYLEPAGETAAYLVAAVQRAPVLAGAAVAGPWADFWLAYPPATAAVVLALVLVVLVLFAAAAWPRLRTDATARMWAIGAALSCLPIAGTFPSDRVLLLVGLGVAPLCVLVIADGLRAGAARWRRAVAIGLIAIHCVAAPLLLPIRARSMATVNASFRHIDRAVPDTPSVEGETLIALNAPNDGMLSYFPTIREAQRRPRPAKLRLLATSLEAVDVERVDDHTLRIRPENGFLATTSERMVRGSAYPFVAGDVVTLSDVSITIEAVSNDGRPTVVAFRFAERLDAPQHRFIYWRGATFEPWTLPEPGQTVTLEGPDMSAMLEDVFNAN